MIFVNVRNISSGSLSRICDAWVLQLRHDVPPTHERTEFHSVRLPGISLNDYTNRLVNSLFYEEDLSAVSVLAVICIDRLHMKYPKNYFVSQHAIHRVVATSVLLATKYLFDALPSRFMVCFAQRAGLVTKELRKLEVRMLRLLGWNLNVSAAEWNRYVSIFDATALSLEKYVKPLAPLAPSWEREFLEFTSLPNAVKVPCHGTLHLCAVVLQACAQMLRTEISGASPLGRSWEECLHSLCASMSYVDSKLFIREFCRQNWATIKELREYITQNISANYVP